MPGWLAPIAEFLAALAKALVLWRARQAGVDSAKREQAEEDLEASQKQARVACDHRADSVDDAVRELRDTGEF